MDNVFEDILGILRIVWSYLGRAEKREEDILERNSNRWKILFSYYDCVENSWNLFIRDEIIVWKMRINDRFLRDRVNNSNYFVWTKKRKANGKRDSQLIMINRLDAFQI